MHLIGISLILFFSIAVQAQNSCLGSKDLTCKALEDILVAHSCAQSGSIKDCRDQISFEKTLAAAGMAAGLRANMRLHMSSMCKKISEKSIFEYLIATAVAVPNTCPIDAQKLNTALKRHIDDIDKVIDADLASQQEHYDLLKNQLLRPSEAIEHTASVAVLDELDRDLQKDPKKFLMDHKLFPGKDTPKPISFAEGLEIKRKREAISAARSVAATLPAAERDKYVGDVLQKVLFDRGRDTSGVPREVAAKYFNRTASNTPSAQMKTQMDEIKRVIAQVDAGVHPITARRLLADLANRFPDNVELSQFTEQAKRLSSLKVEASTFKKQSLNATTGSFNSVDDVIKKASSVDVPSGFQSQIGRNITERFDNFNVMLRHQFGKQHGAKEAQKIASGAVKRYGASSLTTRALLGAFATVGTAATSFAAEIALYSSDAGACSDFPVGQHATYDGDCKAVPAIGPNTFEFLTGSTCEEQFKELSNNEPFCKTLKEYHGFNSPTRWKAKCTSSGFEMMDQTSESPRGYYYETNKNGEITRARVLASENKMSYLSNFAFIMPNENLTEVRRIKVGAQSKAEANNFDKEGIYETLSMADLEKTSVFPDGWERARDAIVDLNLSNYAASTVQTCCVAPSQTNTETCSKYIAGFKAGASTSAQPQSRSQNPSGSQK